MSVKISTPHLPADDRKFGWNAMSTEWTEFFLLYSVDSIDGTLIHGPTPVMRRKNESGRWEYRRMTSEEESEYVSKEAW